MKKLIVLITLCLASLVSQAQNMDIPVAQPKFILISNPKVQDHLKLTDDQKKKLKSQLDAIVQDDGQGHRMITLNGDTDTKQLDKDAVAVLQPDQVKRFDELFLQYNGLTALSVKELADKLGISEEQNKKLEAVWADRQAEIQKLLDPSAGTGEIRMNKADMDKIKAEANKKVEVILTKEQLEKWKSWLGEKFDFGEDQTVLLV